MFNHFDLPTLLPFGLCILLVLIGLHRTNGRLKVLSVKRHRIETFLADLGSYVKSGGNDNQAYLQMLHQAAKLQNEMGSYGIAKYKPPGSQYIFENYQLIVNHLFELERLKQRDDTFLAVAAAIRNGLIIYLGVVDEPESYLRNMKRNPLLLLREGMAWLLVLPFTVFSFLGLLGEDTSDNISQNGMIRFVAGILSILGLLGSIVTIVTGWSQFVQTVMKSF